MEKTGSCIICHRAIVAWGTYCNDCYLRKEASYGLWDLTHEDSFEPSMREFARKFAIKRLMDFTRNELEKYKCGEK